MYIVVIENVTITMIGANSGGQRYDSAAMGRRIDCKEN